MSADGIAEQKDNELDDLLEDIESGLDTTSQDVVTLNTNKSTRCGAHVPTERARTCRSRGECSSGGLNDGE